VRALGIQFAGKIEIEELLLQLNVRIDPILLGLSEGRFQSLQHPNVNTQSPVPSLFTKH
jgi:hypothetical protein